LKGTIKEEGNSGISLRLSKEGPISGNRITGIPGRQTRKTGHIRITEIMDRVIQTTGTGHHLTGVISNKGLRNLISRKSLRLKKINNILL